MNKVAATNYDKAQYPQFIQDGGYHLCAIDESAEHLITIWDWKQDPIIPLAQQHVCFQKPNVVLIYVSHYKIFKPGL